MDRATAPQETKIIYYLDDEDTPYSSKLPIPPEEVTLKDFKSILSIPNGNNNKSNSFKFSFKTEDEELGIVKEVVKDDDARLPVWKGRVVCWITAEAVEGSNVSSGSSSQVTEVSGLHQGRNGQHHHNHHARQTGPLRSVPTGFRGHLNHHNNHASYRNYPGDSFDDTTTTCTEETESIISSRCPRRYHHNHHPRNCGCESDSVSSILTSDMDSTSFVDSDDDSDEDESASRISTTTADTSVSRIHESRYRRRNQRRRRRMPAMSDTSSVSSVTDSTMSMNVITVTLTLDAVSFLGISLVGQPNRGIFVGNIMEGGAVALDGRIDPGDMILQVNDINLENMSNDEAVKILREATSSPGSIRLLILKTWDHNRGNFTIPRSEPVRPIDPGAWVAHTEAARAAGEYPLRPESASTLRSNGSSSLGGSCVTDSERLLGMDHNKIILSLDMEMITIAKSMAAFDSGLDIRDREWLKLKIENAFYGSDVVDWLLNHVQGFNERREAKKYASQMLKQGYLKHPYKKGFSEQSFYVFGEEIVSCMEGINRLRLEAEEESQSRGYPFHRASSSDHSSSDRDTLLLAPGRENGHKHTHSNHSSPHHSSHTAESNSYAEPVACVASSTAASSGGGHVNAFLPWGSDAVHYGIFGGNPNISNNDSDQRNLSNPAAAVSSFKSFHPNQATSFGSNGMSPAHLQHLQHSYQNQHQYAEPTYTTNTSNGNILPEVSSCNSVSLISSSSSGLVDKSHSSRGGQNSGGNSSMGIQVFHD